MEVDYTALGKRVKQIRKERGMSQEQLAEKIDVSVPHMSNIENGKTKFSLQVLISLANALQVSPDALLVEQVDERGKVRGTVLEEINRELIDCSEVQMTLIGEAVRSTKKLLKQYDVKMSEKKGK